MSIYAVVPLKSPMQGKKRLSGVLPDLQRVDLIRAMADHVLGVLAGVDEIERVIVLTTDATLVPASCGQIYDPGPDLNAAVVHAGRVIESLGGSAMLVVAADLPFVGDKDIRSMLAAGRRHTVVLAADAAGVGTNALLISPPATFVPSYGACSLRAHLRIARGLGVSTCVVRRTGLACDIDAPPDLKRLIRRSSGRLPG